MKPTGKVEARKKLKATEKKKAAKATGAEEVPEGRVTLKSVAPRREESPVMQERSRKDIIDYIDPKFARQKRWKIEFDVQKNIRGEDIEMLFREEESSGTTRGHRTYIGPGADGSSDDKICVELRYNSINNLVTFDQKWTHYVKNFCQISW